MRDDLLQVLEIKTMNSESKIQVEKSFPDLFADYNKSQFIHLGKISNKNINQKKDIDDVTQISVKQKSNFDGYQSVFNPYRNSFP